MLTDLSHTPIAVTLWRLASERKSGDLQVRGGKVVKTVFFDHGRIVFAASNLKKDRLGEALVAIGRITQDDFNRATNFFKDKKKPRIGEALIATGILEKQELGRSVARQVERIVLSLFTIEDGVAAFEERACPIPLEFMVSLSIRRLLYQGIKSMKSRELVVTGLGDLDRRFQLAAVAPFDFDPETASPEETEILQQAKRQVTIRRLAWQPGGLASSRLKAVYALVAGGLIEEALLGEAPPPPRPVVQMETGTFLLSALSRKPDPSALEAVRQEVEEELNRSAQLDGESWLKVARGAPKTEIVKAVEEKMDRYRSLLEAAGDDESLRTGIEIVLGRAFSLLRLVQQAPSAPEPAAKPKAEVKPEKAKVKAAEPPPPVEEPAKPPSVEAPPQVTQQVEHMLMEGHVRMTVGDFANAVRVYSRLVEAEPNVGGFRLRLAVAMAHYPRTIKQAEREFLEAIRLEPDNAEYHFQFGSFYQLVKQRARAVSELQTALRLDPHHSGAQELLKAVAPKDSGLVSLRKLFR
ncbi:MAG TPA: DUF4388 domain-containing protein [Vicinamibacteria bacterium]|nr:DUF4388 domain-containing protein [Vicinamibacteria bacterium]